jgi:hypothetical protein
MPVSRQDRRAVPLEGPVAAGGVLAALLDVFENLLQRCHLLPQVIELSADLA